MLLICSAEPRGLCADPRIFDDLTKVSQVFRNHGGSPALQKERPIRRHKPLYSDFFTASHGEGAVRGSLFQQPATEQK